MNQLQYKSMISMLISVTKDKKIAWIEKSGEYTTSIGGCSIHLSSVYDYNVNVSSYSVKLYNDEGAMFESFVYTEDESTEDYQQLNNLYTCIRDVIYKISESENLILNGLKSLTKRSNECDDLPF